ncbi:MFS transporter [Lichenihabitans sp. PAMC28606]|uniref:MFS transporter n=1 Tax=Lichenihabitans sp. PAMC28606 TaxID=2880932 RepID=UPI001D0AC20C|nr:MFS transporter [Lichenihabitans sp. PAMC28606]UDL95729.1 MFS transporter [Lichenihabitans sp. PAMC28606]
MLSLPLLALAIASFGIGTTEFVIMGLLPDVAHSLGVSVPQAGLLVSGYAMGVAVGAPIVAVATARFPRKSALLALMAIFIIGNIACALAPTYTSLMVARVLTAFAHGSFFGIGAVVARDLAPRNKRTQAVALLIGGLTLANMLGVPLGTALGQVAGWRAAFWAVTGIGVIAAGAIAIFVPSGLAGARNGLASEFRALAQWRVLMPMLISATSSVSLFAVFTYITPLLETVSGLTLGQVTFALLLFGFGLTAGNIIGGPFADRNLTGTVKTILCCIIAVLAIFAFTCHAAIPAVLTIMVWGALAFALGAPLQIWVVEAASDAPNLASILNQGAFNFGNAIGAAVGGFAINAGVHYAQLPWLGAGVAVVALALTLMAQSGAKQMMAQRPAE